MLSYFVAIAIPHHFPPVKPIPKINRQTVDSVYVLYADQRIQYIAS